MAPTINRKHTSGAKSKGSTKPKPAKVLLVCPDNTCDEYFRTERALAAHFGRSPSCANVFAIQIKDEACLILAEQQSIAVSGNAQFDATELEHPSSYS